LAGLAEPDKLQQVILDIIAGVPAYPFEEWREIAPLELDRGSATATDQVMMVAVASRCVAVTAILGVDASHKTQVRQQVQGAIHGHQAHGGTVLPGPGVNLSWPGVDPILEERPDDGLAGPGDAVPGLVQLLQNLLL